MRRVACLLVVGIFAAGCSNGGRVAGGDAGLRAARTTLPPVGRAVPSVPRSRSLEVRSIKLAPGDTIAFALHPTAESVSVRSSNPGLELCPATLNGELDTSGGSWSRASGFTACRPFDASGSALVPSRTGHVAFVVRAQRGEGVTIKTLNVSYDAVDQFFVFFPPVARDSSGPDLVITPSRSTVIAAQLFGFPGYHAAADSTIEVKQGKTKLRPGAADPSLNATPYRASVPNKPVVIRVLDTRPRGTRAGLLVEWG